MKTNDFAARARIGNGGEEREPRFIRKRVAADAGRCISLQSQLSWEMSIVKTPASNNASFIRGSKLASIISNRSVAAKYRGCLAWI